MFKITPSKPRLMTNAWVMQPQVFNVSIVGIKGKGNSLCLDFTFKPCCGYYCVIVWPRLAEECRSQPAAPNFHIPWGNLRWSKAF